MPQLFPQGIKGLSDSRFSGLEGSAYKLVGIDFQSTPGLIKVRQKLAKDSGATVDALCKVRLAVSSGESFWFSSTSGKIWRRSSAGVWLLVYTTTAAAGTHSCSGAEEFDGYIYWATQSRLHRIPIAAIATAANWTANAVEDWATFTNTDADFHPMVKQGISLFIGDAHYVAKVHDDGGHTFTAKALNIGQPYRIKTMIDFDIDILLGTYIDDNVNKTEVLRWDTEAESWMSSDTIEESGINAFIRDDNFVYVNAGKVGRMYFYDGKNLIPDKRIPGEWSSTKTATIYPQAVGTFLTVPVFGLSNDAGNPTEQGVYSFGSYSKDYLKVMDLSYPISAGMASVEIGAILVVGEDLLVSWKSASAQGVDKLNWSAKYTSAYIETMILTPANMRHFLKSLLNVFVNYFDLPASTNIVLQYKKKHEAAYLAAVSTVNDTTLMQIRTKEGTVPDVASLQLKIGFTVNGNDAPEIESIYLSDNVKQ